jgi:hypothetical protein
MVLLTRLIIIRKNKGKQVVMKNVLLASAGGCGYQFCNVLLVSVGGCSDQFCNVPAGGYGDQFCNVLLITAYGCGEQFCNVHSAARAAEPETCNPSKCTKQLG